MAFIFLASELAIAYPNIVINGAFNVTTGTKDLGVISGSGTVTVDTGATLNLDAIQLSPTAGVLVDDGTVYFRQSASPDTNGSILSDLQIGGSTGAWTGRLDITNNKLIVEASTNKAGVIAQLLDQVKSGLATGLGIYSSTLPTYESIAVADNAVLKLTTFGGQAVDANSILITDAILGDATLDGKVTGADYTLWADHYSLPSQNWATGDFTHDGLVTGADYTLWADHYGFVPPAQVQGANLGFAPLLLAQPQSVPEPAGLAILGLGAIALLRRGGHKRSGKQAS